MPTRGQGYADELKCKQEFVQFVSAGNLEGAICEVCPRRDKLYKTTHKQFADLIVNKLKLSPKKVIELIEFGGPLYSIEIDELYNVRLELIEAILICAVANDNDSELNLFDALLPLLIYIFPAPPHFNPFSWNLCAAAGKDKSESALVHILRSVSSSSAG